MSFKSIEDLNKHLSSRTYVSGYALSDSDLKAFDELAHLADKSSSPHAFRWAGHVSKLSGKHVTFSSSSKTASAKSAPVAKDVGDDFDMFGDDDDEDEEEKAATHARHARMEAARKLKEEKDAKDGKKKEVKEKPAEKSLLVLEVKPWEADTDLKMVWEEIIKYQQDGLTWGESFKLEPVAYGIMKLVMTCSIVDSKVLMDDITDNIEALDQWVQSVQVASMNKI